MSTSRTARGYDRLAPWYETIEKLRFGGALQSAREALLPCLPPADRILVVGDGDGRLLDRLAATRPEATITSVDISRRMLALQQSRLQHSGRDSHVGWIQGEVGNMHFPEHSFDLLVTAFFLDCFTERQLQQVMPRMARWIAPTGHWYMSDFGVPRSGTRRLWALGWLKIMHLFFRAQTGLESRRLIDPAPIFASLGFAPVQHWRSRSGMLQAVLYRL